MGMVMTTMEDANKMGEALYHEQIIEEACNGNYSINHFRVHLTLEQCEKSFERAQELRSELPLLFKWEAKYDM